MENFCKINTAGRYFVPLHTVSNYGFVSLVNEPHIIECELEPYEFSDFDYKLYAVPVDPNLRLCFERRRFYSNDFRSLIKSGHVVEKTSDDMRVVPMRGAEHLCGSAYLIHDFETIIRG